MTITHSLKDTNKTLAPDQNNGRHTGKPLRHPS